VRHRTRASAGGEQTWKEFMAISSAVSHCGGPRLFGTLIRAPRPAAGAAVVSAASTSATAWGRGAARERARACRPLARVCQRRRFVLFWAAIRVSKPPAIPALVLRW
jgi:hypothetical protein